MINYLRLIHQGLLKFESGLLVSTFLITLLIAVSQIILRNFFDMGIIWADNFLRITVLWLGMMGALIASRKNNHINMNLGQKYLSKQSLRVVQSIIHLFTASICFIITWYGYSFVLLEHEESGLAFANIPVWLTVSIIPISFLIMALRYLTLSILVATGQSVFDQQLANQSESL
jgi:TRAP-type C4-dicarboxylate transport system permease small subunit